MTDVAASFYITRDELVALWHYTNDKIAECGDKIARHGNKAFVTNAENMQKLSDRLDSLEIFAKEQGWLETRLHKEAWHCASIAELNEHWEDFKEPLIKDEKIRKAVRAWAEANGIEACLYDADDFSFNTDSYRINFNTGFDGKTKIYTIAELCGEEE